MSFTSVADLKSSFTREISFTIIADWTIEILFTAEKSYILVAEQTIKMAKPILRKY